MSAQQDRYLYARGTGCTISEACAWASITTDEARLIERAVGNGELSFKSPALPGHNSGETTMVDNVAADQLRLFIERVERLEEEKKSIADDIRDVYAEAKSQGYDTRTMREVVKLRRLETHVRQEREALLDTYKAALGLDYSETPLGQATLRSVA